LCIILLDYLLYSNIYNSVVVGFLIVLGISLKSNYYEAMIYTPSLSIFIKLS
ncbi:hypothetical protein F5882DRAFT_306975, partial [Hyaloscypha sp. PMI_1271]